MGADLWIVIQWWGTLFLVGAAAFPLTKKLFLSWYDHGYLFSKAVGMAVVTYLVYLLGILHVSPFSQLTAFAVLGVVFAFGIALSSRPPSRDPSGKNTGFRVKTSTVSSVEPPGMTIFFEELFFLAALLFWSWVKGHEPSIRGLEKFMDYGFMQSILNSSWFPAPDMWYAGLPINYYYFGHTVVAVLTKLSAIDLSYTFNLMLATIFALTLTMSFSIGKQIGGGLLTAFLVTLAGNMQTLYAFTRGYTGEDVKPFWQLLWPVGEFFSKLPEGLERYWYANATRFIPFTIHEFPSYSFVVSDVHGHVMSIPFVLLAIALLIQRSSAIFYGFLAGVLLMTNALDGPIYLGLFVALFVLANWSNWTNWTNWKKVGIVAGAAVLASLPFLWYFKSFVSGVAVNCPPAFLANTKIGPLIFEGVEKCQHSPLWMLWILWGFFWFCGVALIVSRLSSRPSSRDPSRSEDGFRVKPGMTQKKKRFTQIEKVLVVFFFFSLALIFFSEFFYFKDIYPAHFRSNTMFKLGYQAFIMLSIVSGYVIAKAIRQKPKIFLLLLIPQLFLVSIYPVFSVRSYFDSLRSYKGLDGLAWLSQEYPDDYMAIEWLNRNAKCQMPNAKCKSPVIAEADGDSYTDYARFSAFTGLPTIVGWPVHEWLWRGTYDVVAPRREDVRIVYESENVEETRQILANYGVSYIIVGALEREKYPELVDDKFSELGTEVFRMGNTAIYQIPASYVPASY